MEPWDASKRKLCVAVPQFMFEFLANGHLSRETSQSVNEKGHNEMKPVVLHRSPDIYHKSLRNPGKS